jgi:hypothetical protein
MALARTREALHNGWDKKLKAKTGIWHRLLTHYLPLYFPEIERFAGNSRSDWFLAFLERFPTPASITALAKDTFVATAWDVVGRKVSKARLLGDIYETARISAALPVPLDAPAIAMFRLVLAEARSLVRQRNVIEAQAHELRRTHPDYLRLRQVPGIGPTHALTILAEAGDLRRFQFRGQTRLSKFGTPACDGPFGWRPRSQSISAITASAITSAVTSPRIATTRTCGARR